jgi:cysteine desulfurase/selenocysteine lyase
MIDDSTRLVTVSHVAHSNGYVHDLTALVKLAHSHRAYLHVDAIQAVGAIRLDVREAGVDFLTSGAYKWLLGPIGLGFLYVSEEALSELEPPHGGWRQVSRWQDDLPLQPPRLYKDARKLEMATIHFQGLYELKAALEYIGAIGIDRIENQVLRLSSHTWHGLNELGLPLNTPPQTDSGIVTCRLDDVAKTACALEEAKIVATFRAGNQLRVSPHFFNTTEEVDCLLDVLASIGGHATC